jgi:hypothetical protein
VGEVVEVVHPRYAAFIERLQSALSLPRILSFKCRFLSHTGKKAQKRPGTIPTQAPIRMEDVESILEYRFWGTRNPQAYYNLGCLERL